MHCRLWTFVLWGTGLIGLAGCTAHNLETRLISSFIENLEKSDIEELKDGTSVDFKGSALRHEKAVEAFKMLNLPEGKVTVVSVKETSPDEKRVLVKVGEQQRKLYFDLIRDTKTNKWVVHDVEIKKNLKPGQVNKSVTEQMDLLLSIQELLDAWESGERDLILAASTADLRKSLEPLPAKSLKQFSARIMSDFKRDKVKPTVDGHAKMALVRLKRKGVETLITMRLEEDKWVADDIAIDSKKENGSMPSLRKHTHVMLTAIRFCEAYQTGNKDELVKLSDPGFYRRALLRADLARVPLPVTDPEKEDFDIKLMATRAEVLIKREDQIVQLSLSQGPPQLDDEGNPIETEASVTKPFLVEEITFHEISTNQDKRLSAMTSSSSLVLVFAEALSRGDLKSLRIESTTDFQNRVWSKIELDDYAELPLDQIESVPPVILDTAFKGPLTEVTVNQGSTPLTYVLRDQNGRLLVDDVLTPALDRPNSLKMTLEVQIPLRNFAKGLRTNQMRLVRDNASREFNKLVFQSMNRLPQLRSDPAPFLEEPVNRIQLNTDRALLVLGDEHFGAKVLMNKEGDHYVIDDITMINGVQQAQRTGLKQSLREMVLKGTRFGTNTAKTPHVVESLEENADSKPVVLGADRTPKFELDSDATSSGSRIERASYRSTGREKAPVQERGRRPSPRRSADRDAEYEKDVNADADLDLLDMIEAEESPSRSAAVRSARDYPVQRAGGVMDSAESTDPILDLLDGESGTDSQYSSPSGNVDDIDVIQPPE